MADFNEEVESEDILSDSLQVLYDYTPITYSSAGSIFRYQPPPQLISALPIPIDPFTITLLTPSTQAGNWSLHASSIWASSIYLADHIQDLHIAQYSKSSGRPQTRVLELGAGAGLPSILVAKLHENVSVVVSDYPDDEIIKALVTNIDENNVSSRCRAIPYAWDSDTSVFRDPDADSGSEAGNIFDIVIAADTLWNSGLHALFLRALQKTLRRSADARVYLVAGLHTGRYTLQAFMDAVPRHNFQFEEICEREVAGSASRPWDVERHEYDDDRERRRWVVWMVLRWTDTAITTGDGCQHTVR